MSKQFTWCLGALLVVFPVSGALFTVPQGGTTFIGEQGLESPRPGRRAVRRSDGSERSVMYLQAHHRQQLLWITQKTSMLHLRYLVGETGPWYTLPDKKLASEPNINIQNLKSDIAF